MRLLGCLVVVVAVTVAGCETDLGKCDMAAAKKLVYTPTGVPFYEGQALVYQSCAGAFCHASGAKSDARFGVPHGLNFDVNTLTATATPDELSALKDGIARVRDQAGEIYDLVESGEMPPGKAGERVLMPWKSADSAGALTDTEVPDPHDGAGKEVLRNWLACDAPIVAGTKDAPADVAKYGDVLDAVGTTIEPTLQDVHAKVLSGVCTSCHNGKQFLSEQALDFSSEASTLATLVGKDAFGGGACDSKAKLVVAGDCENSLLFQKLTGVDASGAAVCGSKMPLGAGMVSQAALDALCEWIDMGAAP